MTKNELDELWGRAVFHAGELDLVKVRYEFAALVAAAQAEKDAQICEALEYYYVTIADFAAAIRARATGNGDTK